MEQAFTAPIGHIEMENIVGSSTNELHVVLDTTKLQAQSSEYGETKI
jgi:TATA-box binding protein (TBP) (component of TFIID and TFIIIB)